MMHLRSQCCLASSLMTGMMGQSTPLASLQVVLHWEEWLRYQVVCIVIQQDLDRLEKQATRNLLKYRS